MRASSIQNFKFEYENKENDYRAHLVSQVIICDRCKAKKSDIGFPKHFFPKVEVSSKGFVLTDKKNKIHKIEEDGIYQIFIDCAEQIHIKHTAIAECPPNTHMFLYSPSRSRHTF